MVTTPTLFVVPVMFCGYSLIGSWLFASFVVGIENLYVNRATNNLCYSPSEMVCLHEKYLAKLRDYLFRQMKADKLFRSQGSFFSCSFF